MFVFRFLWKYKIWFFGGSVYVILYYILSLLGFWIVERMSLFAPVKSTGENLASLLYSGSPIFSILFVVPVLILEVVLYGLVGTIIGAIIEFIWKLVFRRDDRNMSRDMPILRFLWKYKIGGVIGGLYAISATILARFFFDVFMLMSSFYYLEELVYKGIAFLIFTIGWYSPLVLLVVSLVIVLIFLVLGAVIEWFIRKLFGKAM